MTLTLASLTTAINISVETSYEGNFSTWNLKVMKISVWASISINSLLSRPAFPCSSIQCLQPPWPRQNGSHFTDAIFKCILLNEIMWILLKISLKFVPKVQIDNIPTLVQIMAWHQSGDKPSSGPMIMMLVYWRIYASIGLNELTAMSDYVRYGKGRFLSTNFRRVNFDNQHVINANKS